MKTVKKVEQKRGGKEWRASMQLFTESFRLCDDPFPEEKLENMSRDLIEWCKNDPDAYRLEQFWNKHNIYRAYITRWKRNYPWFRNVIDQALSLLADRRETKALKNEINTQMVLNSMGMYDPEWKAYLQWKSDMAKEADNAPKTIFVRDFK